MSKYFPSVVKEFFRALGKGYTYNLKKNYYTIFGILWGIPVPIVTIGMGLYFCDGSFTFEDIILQLKNYPINLFFLLHPILFGIVFGAMGTVREEKERQRLKFEESLLAVNDELKRVNKKLKELDELKDNFLSMVSHELLSPLTTVQGYITFLQQEKAGKLTDGQAEALSITNEQTEHLKHLIEELMDLSKLDAGRFEVKISEVDINDVIKKVISNLKQKYDESRITIRNKIPDQLPLVMADSLRMMQVFDNILGNAIKFTNPKGQITISAFEKDSKVEFCVEDNGVGIPDGKIDRVFDRFYQVDSTTKRKHGGCGLGLTITKSIIDLHNGRIWAESKVGSGTKFFFELEKSKTKNNKNFISNRKEVKV